MSCTKELKPVGSVCEATIIFFLRQNEIRSICCHIVTFIWFKSSSIGMSRKNWIICCWSQWTISILLAMCIRSVTKYILKFHEFWRVFPPLKIGTGEIKTCPGDSLFNPDSEEECDLPCEPVSYYLSHKRRFVLVKVVFSIALLNVYQLNLTVSSSLNNQKRKVDM